MIITITGKPCSGKSTVAKIIEQKFGFKRIGVGDMFKQEANKRGMSAEEFNALCISDPSYDYFIDNKTKEMGEELEGQNYIFDSRLAWHFVPKSFKVFVDLDEDEMANRLVLSDREGKEKYDNFDEAKRSLVNREKLERERYKKIYNVDIYDTTNYDFVTDSNKKTPEQVVEEIWTAYQKHIGGANSKKEEKISVITGVYNVEKYLERCVKSIQNQTYKNLEIILVDDGSKDESGKICDELAKKDKRIKVVHKKNGGVSSAWNAGLDNATGKFIAFVDSDDYVDEHYIEKMYDAIKKYNCDIAICGNYIVSEKNGNVSVKEDFCYPELDTKEKYFSGSETRHVFFGEKRFRHTSWGKLYRKEIYNNIRYPEDCRVVEDSYMIYDICKSAKNGIVVIADRLLYYIMRNDNVTNTVSEKRFDWIKAKRHLCETVEEELDIYKYVVQELFVAYECLYKQFKNGNRKDFLKKLNIMINDDWKRYSKFLSKKAKFKYWVFKYFRNSYFLLKKMLRK